MQQTVDSPSYFILSGFLAFFLFFLFLFAFVYMIFSVKTAPVYAFEKKNYITISLEMNSMQKRTEKKVAKQHLKQKPKQKFEKLKQKARSEVEDVSENIDVDSLFNNVWTKKIDTKTKKRQKIDVKRIAEIQKKVEILNNQKSGENNTKQSYVDNQGEKTAKTTSAGEEVNEYLAKIHAIVYEHFFPPPNSEGEQIKAVIELSPLGKVTDFRILNYSASQALNDEADQIKKRLRGVLFPRNPNAKTARVIVILKPENKE